MTGVLLVLLLLTTTAMAARIPARKQAWQWKYKVWMPAVYQRIAWCESGSRPPADPIWTHRAGAYGGAFGFHDQTWATYRLARYPLRAERATPFQQFQVARRLHALFGWTPWGCWHNAWVRG